jgi:hypothetical protein
MSDERKIIDEYKAGEQRKEREKKRRALFQRIWGTFKFLLVMTIFVVAFIHRVELQKVCLTVFNGAMKHLGPSSQMRQKSTDYQNQLDGITTN